MLEAGRAAGGSTEPAHRAAGLGKPAGHKAGSSKQQAASSEQLASWQLAQSGTRAGVAYVHGWPAQTELEGVKKALYPHSFCPITESTK